MDGLGNSGKVNRGFSLDFHNTTVNLDSCTSDNFLVDIKDLRQKNINMVIIVNININSLRNKVEQVKVFILKFSDILVITETKLDDSFPTSQFEVEGFCTPLRLDRSRYGGVL